MHPSTLFLLDDIGLAERFACPMDAWWFRLPRRDDDPSGLVGGLGDRFFTALIDRGDYWQCATLIPKGTDTERRAEGLERFTTRFAAAAPWPAGRPTGATPSPPGTR